MTQRIFVLIDTAIIGGPGKGLFQLLRHLDTSQFDYRLSNFEYPVEQHPLQEFNDHARAHDFQFCPLPVKSGFDLAMFSQALRLVREENCTLLQSHGYKAHLVCLFVSKVARLKWISCSHGFSNENARVRFYNWLEKVLVRFSDAAIAVSKPLHDMLRNGRGTRKPSYFIPNAVELEVVPVDAAADTSAPVIGTVGRLSPEKGHLHLLQAFKQLLEQFPNARLMIVGEGQERDNLAREIQQLGLSDQVELCPYTSDIKAVYAKLDLFVLPSLAEGIPNVLLEAMANSVPCVATRVGSVPDVVEDGVSGVLVEAGDPQAFGEAMCKVLAAPADERRCMVDAARDKLAREFSPSVRAGRFQDVYESLS